MGTSPSWHRLMLGLGLTLISQPGCHVRQSVSGRTGTVDEVAGVTGDKTPWPEGSILGVYGWWGLQTEADDGVWVDPACSVPSGTGMRTLAAGGWDSATLSGHVTPTMARPDGSGHTWQFTWVVSPTFGFGEAREVVTEDSPTGRRWTIGARSWRIERVDSGAWQLLGAGLAAPVSRTGGPSDSVTPAGVTPEVIGAWQVSSKLVVGILWPGEQAATLDAIVLEDDGGRWETLATLPAWLGSSRH